MEQKISLSHRRGDLSASDSESDPEREFSGDDDDDRNHKHRRRDIRPQSSEFDALQSASSKPFNKRNKSFQNGNSFRGNGSRMNGGWKDNSFAPSDNELLNDDRRHFDMPKFSRPQMDLNQRYGLVQTYFGDSGFARGRGRDSWNAHAPGFGSMEFSQAANHGFVSSNLYAGRGVPNVTRVHTAAWNPYGLLPGIHSGGLDAVHSLGINPSHRPPINPPSTSGIIRQKCRDFEERGFCLRGDMCPMEHGVNRIVVDDVQSLSKFNLPVSIPVGNGLGVGGGSTPIPVGTASASFSVNNSKIHRKMGKSKTARKGTNGDAVGVFSNSAAAGNDFYDPDQPLLNKNGAESSTLLSQPCSPEIQHEKPVPGGDPSSENPDEVHNGSSIYPLSESACSGADTHNFMQSSLGSLHGVASGSEPKGKVSIIPNRPDHNNYILDKDESINKNQMTNAQGICVLSENKDTNSLDASQRIMKVSSRNSQKPPQKAMRTIFVNGIPQKDKNIQALRSHFQKFGEIIDIYIPANGERAFVQFSTREEAEAALKAPDAVMGNRFIKIWWANRDSIPDTGSSGGNNPYVNPLVGNAYSGPNPFSISSQGRSNILPASKASATLAPSSTSNVNAVSSAQINMSDQGKHGVGAGPVALAPSQKKLENLEVLKEELRKKQELLEQKRNEFKQQLDKLEKQKQVVRVKCESSSEHPAKRQKAAMTADVAKRAAPQSADTSTFIALTEAQEVAQKVNPANKPLVRDPNTASESTTRLNVMNLPLAETEHALMNSSKLEMRPSSFKIVPPLPSELANIVTLREHFSLYDKVYDVELVNADSDEWRTAIISFGTHLSAEKAFHSGKSLNGHDLQFTWVSGYIGEHDKISSAAEEHMDVDTASQNNVLQKEAVSRPDVDSKATAEYVIDKVAVPEEKVTPHEELVEDQLSVYGAEKASYSRPAEDAFMKPEEQLSGEGYAEKADDEKSHNEDSLKRVENQDSDEDPERAYDKPLSGDEFQRSYEEHPPHIDFDHRNEEHPIEEVEEMTHEDEDQLSEDDVMLQGQV